MVFPITTKKYLFEQVILYIYDDCMYATLRFGSIIAYSLTCSQESTLVVQRAFTGCLLNTIIIFLHASSQIFVRISSPLPLLPQTTYRSMLSLLLVLSLPMFWVVILKYAQNNIPPFKKGILNVHWTWVT